MPWQPPLIHWCDMMTSTNFARVVQRNRNFDSLAHLTLAMILCLIFNGISVRADELPTASEVEYFEKNIRPLFVEHCHACHSSESERLRGGLRLDVRSDWLTGGDLGPAVEPGDPEKSLLMEAIRHEDVLLKMPPKGKLSDREIDLFERWILMGAPGPLEEGGSGAPGMTSAAIDLEVARRFWVFQTPEEPSVPLVKDVEWPRNDLDCFILSELESNGLKPAQVADRRTWIRRATFDLIGLPPTPEEIQAFLADESPDAFEKVLERLLAAPQYGERWGRHWLDVARYADSNGLDENVAHGNAWRYRDYVVQSFNNDKPYNQFLVEQLAGDLLPESESLEETHERLIATGFLTLGPKVLAEPDKVKMEMDIIDEQVDTVGRAFLGLTIGCARCHDHKFDPILTADYYALAGIFKSTQTMESLKTIARWHENSIAREDDLEKQSAHEKKVEAAKANIASVIEQANEQLLAKQSEGCELPEKPEELYPEATKDQLKKLRESLDEIEKSAPEIPTAMGVLEKEAAEDIAIHIRGSHLTLGDVVPRRVPLVISSPVAPSIGEDQSGRLELAHWMASDEHPLTARVMVNRIWRWHFGRGLVNTPDNFGALGETPSHPELLDWLARRFVESGWSIKQMHRIIMLSSTYRVGSDYSADGISIDPENRLYWRMNLRRLEAEPIRDALLAVSGLLNRELGGSLLQVKNREFFFNHTSEDKTSYESFRRSIYLPVVRNHLFDMFELFDGTDASVTNGDRATTTVAPQALFMLNSDLVLESAKAFADRLLKDETRDDAGRIDLLYELAYGRLPRPEERRRAEAFLEEFASGEQGEVERRHRQVAWQGLCQLILAANEFLYLR